MPESPLVQYLTEKATAEASQQGIQQGVIVKINRTDAFTLNEDQLIIVKFVIICTRGRERRDWVTQPHRCQFNLRNLI